jgi:hypothetical protein
VEEDLQSATSGIANRHAAVTDPDEAVLEEAENRCLKDDGDAIKAKHGTDPAQIAKDLAAVNQCDTVRVTMGEEAALRITVPGAARDGLKQARDEEARLKGITDAASNALESFTSTTNSEEPPFDMPPATDKDAADKCFEDREVFCRPRRPTIWRTSLLKC